MPQRHRRSGPDVSGAALAGAVSAFDSTGWPHFELIDEETLHGARGAYDRTHDTIYLSQQFLASATSESVTSVLVEEIGHAIDARVNGTDAPGDEGAIFARFVTGHAPSTDELAALKSENDHTTINIAGHATAVELAAPVVGAITLDGSLADWSAGDQIDSTLSVSGYDIYARATGDSYVFALQAPEVIGANTTVWLNTDQNAATGYQIWGFAGGTEFNINFDSSGAPRLYTGNAGQTLVAGATVSFGYSADHTAVEFAIATSAIGSPQAINTLWDINDNTFLPTDYSLTQFAVAGTSTAARPDAAAPAPS